MYRPGKPCSVQATRFLVMLHKNDMVTYVHVGYDKSQPVSLIEEVNALLNEPGVQ